MYALESVKVAFAALTKHIRSIYWSAGDWIHLYKGMAILYVPIGDGHSVPNLPLDEGTNPDRCLDIIRHDEGC